MMRKILRQIRYLFYLIPYCKNWYTLVLLAVQGKRATKIILRNGIKVEAPLANTLFEMVMEIFGDKVYTPPDLPIESNDLVVDIGANIGLFTMYAAQKTANKVYAFEPFPENVLFIKQNIESNGFHNVIIDSIAVSDQKGTENLYLSEISGGHLLFEHNIKGKLDDSISVPTKTIEGIMKEYSIKEIDFLKLDCEGSEGQIIRSAPSNILRRIKKIAMEFHDNVSVLKHGEIKRRLEDHGFSCTIKWDGRSQFGYLYARR